MSNNLDIIQYNCGNSNYKATRTFFDAIPRTIQIIALQEPYYSNGTKTTYCPRAFNLSYERKSSTKTAFLINKKIQISSWSRTQLGPEVASLQVQLQSGPLTIINVYNQRKTDGTIPILGRLRKAIQEAMGEVIVLGDFNIHHSAWGGPNQTDEPAGTLLLREMEEAGLTLRTPTGSATWRRRDRRTVIDLTFATRNILQRTWYCRPEEEWALTQDHIPILIRIDAATIPTQARTRYDTKRFDPKTVEEAIANHPATEWDITALYTTIQEKIAETCPLKKNTGPKRAEWSHEIAKLLRLTRQAKRRLFATGSEAARNQYRSTQNALKNEIRRDTRAKWRNFLIKDLEDAEKNPQNRLLWKMSKWSRRTEDGLRTDPQMPGLKAGDGTTTTNPECQTEILSKKFFSEPVQIPHSHTASVQTQRLTTDELITEDEVLGIIQSFPTRKAPGPDRITTEMLKAMSSVIAGPAAKAFTHGLKNGQFPSILKDSTTIALRKPKREDYSEPGSYRPIALENSFAKMYETALARRLTDLAEQNQLLPWNQMGARRGRSTEAALRLLVDTVELAWKANPKNIVTILGLDIAGAFDNVSIPKLHDILRKKGVPESLSSASIAFTVARRTRIAIPGYDSEWIETNSGIPQGSPLSPILFLFFASDLLEELNQSQTDTVQMGFVDDTTIITYSLDCKRNCEVLKESHSVCERWAVTHGAKFAPAKYQLMHVTKPRRSRVGADATMTISGQTVELCEVMKILGVWVDKNLTWKPHVKKTAERAMKAVIAMKRITASTWGVSIKKARLLYTATVRPIITYAAPIWGVLPNGEAQPNTLLGPLRAAQSAAIRTIFGAYKKTPVMLLEKEAGILPVRQHIEMLVMTGAVSNSRAADRHIMQSLDTTWTRLHRDSEQTPQRPRTALSNIYLKAACKALSATEEERKRREGTDAGQRRRRPRRAQNWTQKRAIKWKAAEEQKEEWIRESAGKHQTMWRGGKGTLRWYEGLNKAEATALFLLRSEVIGLKAWLARYQGAERSPACSCGWTRETVEHVLVHCPDRDRSRLPTDTEWRMPAILLQEESARKAAKWLVAEGILPHLRAAREVEERAGTQREALPDLYGW